MDSFESTLPRSEGSTSPSRPRFLSQYPQKQFDHEYVQQELLGKGTFGVVRRCWHKYSNTTRAVKIIDVTQLKGSAMDDLEREISIQGRAGWKGVVGILDVFAWENTLYVVQEWARGGDLMQTLLDVGKFSEVATAGIIHQLLNIILSLHNADVVHRDIKPSNILLTRRQKRQRHAHLEGELQLTDFGFATNCWETATLNRTCGTPLYMAPEVIKKASPGKPCDMWSIGITTYILLSGHSPFKAANLKELFRQVIRGVYRPMFGDHWRGISNNAKAFIQCCLELDPKKRMTAGQALAHPWLGHLSQAPTPRRKFRAAVQCVRATWRLATLQQRRVQKVGLQVIDLHTDWVNKLGTTCVGQPLDATCAPLLPSNLSNIQPRLFLDCTSGTGRRAKSAPSATGTLVKEPCRSAWSIFSWRRVSEMSWGLDWGWPLQLNQSSEPNTSSEKIKWLVLWDNAADALSLSSEWTVVDCLQD